MEGERGGRNEGVAARVRVRGRKRVTTREEVGMFLKLRE